MLSYLIQDFPLKWFVSKPSEDYFKWFTTQIEVSIEHAYRWLLYDVLVFRIIHEIYPVYMLPRLRLFQVSNTNTHITHTIHVWYIYLELVDFDGI